MSGLKKTQGRKKIKKYGIAVRGPSPESLYGKGILCALFQVYKQQSRAKAAQSTRAENTKKKNERRRRG